ncbi:hypothetical protein [Kitasatospora azatica]|uniref:hypothetical protein n=1 Tax=Kitasatospora azatica TaxID=58347 RepID=UPI00055AEAFA|nr:hypothetical protein [Kitasatospora azatica]
MDGERHSAGNSARRRWAFLLCLLLAAIAVAVVSTSGGGKKAAPAPAPTVGEQLRGQDTAAKLPGVGSGADYNSAFDTLSARCQEQGASLGDEVQAVLELLQKNGVTDENRLTVMQHLAATLPAGVGQQQSCAQAGNAYVTKAGQHP